MDEELLDRSLLRLEEATFHASKLNDTSFRLSAESFLERDVSVFQPNRTTQFELPSRNKLFHHFAEIIQLCPGGTEILETAVDFARCLSDTLTVIRQLKPATQVQGKSLEEERNIWQLLFVLYQDRIKSLDCEIEPEYEGRSEKLCVESLYRRDRLLRESQLVIDWLERCALERDDPILHHSDWTYGWEHTLHEILAPESIAIPSNVKVVKTLHPDAPHFEDGALHHLDQGNERKLWQRVFMEIRCGKLEEAQNLCCNCGHPWRGAMLEGWKLYHDPNIDDRMINTDPDKTLEPGPDKMDEGSSSDSDYALKETEELVEETYEDVEGNVRRDLWKATALKKFCQQAHLNPYEKASVAAFCGHLDSLVPVCNTWEDLLWAYMRTMVDVRVESEVRDRIKSEYVSLPEEYWQQRMSVDEIFLHLATSKNDKIRSEAQDRDHIIQKHIILDEIPNLIKLLDQWSDDPTLEIHSMRFFAHLILFFDHIGVPCNRASSEKIIESYISRLSDRNLTELVAYYTSKLGHRKQVVVYSTHLVKIQDEEERKSAYGYMSDFSLDIFAITKRVVETIINKASDPQGLDNLQLLQTKVTPDDNRKISALDWLLFEEFQRLEALIQSNSLIFTFLTLRKIDAAHLAISKIPKNSVDLLTKEHEDEEVQAIVKEHLSYAAYLDAHENFNSWFVQFQSRPNPPPEIPEGAEFVEKIAHQHRWSQYNAELGRWKLTTAHSAKTAKTSLYNVLLFPERWHLDNDNGKYLRSVCIPEMVLLLCSVLWESGSYSELVQLADLVANEKYGLYKVYSKEKLSELLEKIAEGCVALLKESKDPFGSSQ